ncbi:MAG TPA: hypothetical protein VIJ61_17065, partial [Thermoanaerobaculia bacterium]
METRLVLIADGRRDRERERHRADELGGHAGLARRLHLLLQVRELVWRLRVEIGGNAREVAADRVLLDQRGDPLQGGARGVDHRPQI